MKSRAEFSRKMEKGTANNPGRQVSIYTTKGNEATDAMLMERYSDQVHAHLQTRRASQLIDQPA
jgi:hypothetical protein